MKAALDQIAQSLAAKRLPKFPAFSQKGAAGHLHAAPWWTEADMTTSKTEVPPCPILSLRLTVLVENTSLRPGLIGQHGFAALLETERGTILFDTGATGEALAANARALGVDLSRVGAIVLSHGHYDHTGGLSVALAAAPGARLYLHEQTLVKRWGSRLGFKKSIGIPDKDAACRARPQWETLESPRAIPEGVVLSGPIPGPPSPAERGFLVASGGRTEADRFTDEIFLLARTAAAWVLVTGCCHRGLPNTLAHAQGLSGGEPIRAVVGGFHLKRLSRADLDAAVKALDAAGTREILAGHCTGEKAADYLAAHARARVERLHVGFQRQWGPSEGSR